MRSLRLPIVGIAIFCALLLCVVISLGNGNAVASASVSSPTPVSTAQVTQEPPGAPAITPSIQPNTVGTATSPTYTANDVRQYIKTRGFVGGPVVKGATLTITSIQFITASQASQLMGGESVGRSSTELVCYVEVKGPFNAIHMHLLPSSGTNGTTIRQSGVMVFDAYTGNLLLWGVSPV